jgi:putative glycosyltransferase (TIGR04372 family)
MKNRGLSVHHDIFKKTCTYLRHIILIPNCENIGNSFEDYYFSSLTAVNSKKKLIIIEPKVNWYSNRRIKVDFSYLKLNNSAVCKNKVLTKFIYEFVRVYFYTINFLLHGEFIQKLFLKYFNYNLNDYYLTPSLGQDIAYNPLSYAKISPENLIETKKFYSHEKPCIEFSKEDEIKCVSILRNYGIKESDWFVSIHIRDGYYKSDYSNIRNCNPENFRESINYILGKGGFVIIMGDSNYKFNIDHARFIKYNKSNSKNSLVDAFIISRSRFFIATPSGIFDSSLLFTTPVLLTNQVNTIDAIPLKSEDRFMYKKIFSKQLDRFLTLQEFVTLKKHSDQLMLNSDFIWEENSPDELLSATKEMLDTDSVTINVLKQAKLKELVKLNNSFLASSYLDVRNAKDNIDSFRFLVRHEISKSLIVTSFLDKYF